MATCTTWKFLALQLNALLGSANLQLIMWGEEENKVYFKVGYQGLVM